MVELDNVKRHIKIFHKTENDEATNDETLHNVST